MDGEILDLLMTSSTIGIEGNEKVGMLIEVLVEKGILSKEDIDRIQRVTSQRTLEEETFKGLHAYAQKVQGR